jgi:IPT/TIG domain
MSKIVPVIFDLSFNQGYVTGGQNLSISGFGFMGGNISVSVAGLPCNVSFFTNTEINC